MLVTANAKGGNVLMWSAIVGLCGLGGVLTLGLSVAALPDPTAHAHTATLFALLGYGFLHCAIGLVFTANVAMKYWLGFVSARRSVEVRVASVWHRYTAITGLIVIAFAFAVPFLPETGGV